MPHPATFPNCREWGMGVRLWLTCVLRKCRTLSTAVVILCLWMCLITIINSVSDDDSGTVALGEDSQTLLRPNDVVSSSAKLRLPASALGGHVFRSAKIDARLLLRHELKSSVSEARLTPGQAPPDQETSAQLENGIIGGRRIQGIKAGEMEGLESLSRRYERDPREGGQSVAGGGRREGIDTGDSFKMGIARTAQELSQDSGDLRSNWTPQLGPNSAVSNIPGQGLKLARQESQQAHIVSSRERNSFLKSSSELARKLGSEGEDAGPGTLGLHGRGKSIEEHLPQSVVAAHNRGTGLHNSGRSQAINKHFNSDESFTLAVSESGEKTHNSQTRPTASSNPYLTSPVANLDKAPSTQTLKAPGSKSNQEWGIAMQMDVPKRNTGLSPAAAIDQSANPMARQMLSGVKYPTQPQSFLRAKDKSNQEGKTSVPSPSSHAKARNESTAGPRPDKRSKSSDLRDQQRTPINPAFIKQPVSGTHGQGDGAWSGNSLHSGASLEVGRTNGKMQRQLKYDGFDLYSYNVTASDWLSLSRDIPDTRPQGCPNAEAYNESELPRASVVICFHNEALSVLLRTVHSVLERTPAHLLEKLILVDDHSDMDDLKSELDYHLRELDPRIVLTRTTKREGLVRSRLIGSNLATSEVLVFLDAHCECNKDWLQPLLAQIAQGPDQVVCPYIDTIRAESFQYKQSPADLQGGFNWRLEFGWRAATDTSRADTDPVR